MNNQFFSQYQQVPYYNSAQQRLYQMEQQYPQFSQNNIQQFKCRPVTSIDEAKAAMIDLDGTPSVFTNFANGKIYVKYTNLDGTAAFDVYDRQKQNNVDNSMSVLQDLSNRVKKMEEVIANESKCDKNDANNKNAKK